MSQPLSTSSANKQIFRALLSISSAVLLIRFMGMLNQVVITARFGAGAAMDTYFVATALPLLVGNLAASGIEGSVIPVYVRVRGQRTKEQASIFISTLVNLLLVGAVLVTLVMLLFRQQLIFLSAPGLNSLLKDFAIGLTPFIYPVILLMVMNSFLECILNTEGQFGWPAYAGLLVPLTTAVIVLTADSSQGVVILCIGVLLGQFLQLCTIILRARLAGLVYRPVINLRDPAITLICIAAWPPLFNGLISQGSPLIDQIFASSLSAGSISALNYSLKLVSVVTAVIFGPTGRALLPHLSHKAQIKDYDGFKETLRLYLWIVAIGTTLLAGFILVLAHPLVQILFQRGAFTAQDTSRTASILTGFVIGLTPMAFGFIVSRAFSSLSKNHLLVYVTLFSVIANAIFDYVFARIWGGMGIALATSAVYFCTMFILLFTLRRTIGKLHLFTPPDEIRAMISKVAQKLGLRSLVRGYEHEIR